MCIQDVRIGERLTQTRGSASVPAAGVQSLTRGRANRYRLAVSFVPAIPVAAPNSVSIQVVDGGVANTIAVLTLGNAFAMLTVEHYGADLYQVIQVTNNSDVAVTVSWTEYNLPIDPGEI